MRTVFFTIFLFNHQGAGASHQADTSGALVDPGILLNEYCLSWSAKK